jgi:hypothetical protein
MVKVTVTKCPKAEIISKVRKALRDNILTDLSLYEKKLIKNKTFEHECEIFDIFSFIFLYFNIYLFFKGGKLFYAVKITKRQHKIIETMVGAEREKVKTMRQIPYEFLETVSTTSRE